MISNRHVNGDVRSPNRLNKPEQLFVFGFRSPTHGAVAIDDQVSRPGIQSNYFFGRLCEAIGHEGAFMLILLHGRTGPLGTGVR